MAIAESAKTMINDIADNIWNNVYKFLASNKEFLAGMGVGAALSTKAGKDLIHRLGGDAKKLAELSQQYGKKAVSDAWKYYMNSKASKVNLFEQAGKSGSKVNKVVNAAAKVSATKIAGEILGASIGNIATSKNFGEILLHANPVGATVDAVKENINWMKEKNAQKKESKNAVESVIKAVQEEGVRLKDTEDALRTGKQVVEYERSKANKSTTGETTSDKLAKFMKQKQKGNHPIWYGGYPNYVTSNLQWGERKEALGTTPTAAGTQITVGLVIPQEKGAVSSAYKDAINMIYVKVRGSNSGAFNYDPVDVAAYIECTRCIRALHAQLCRDVKLVNNVDPYIIQTPDIMMAIAGYDAAGIADIKANRVSYINELNQLAAVIENRFPEPPAMPVFDRSEYVATTIIEEGKGPKSSVYVYRLGSISKAKGNSTQEMAVVDVDLNSLPLRLAALRGMIDDADGYANPTYGDHTFTKIAGDLMKAYGEKSFRKPESVQISDKAVVLFDQYLLTQIQNMVGPQIGLSINPLTLLTYSDAYSVTYKKQVLMQAATGETNTVPVKKIQGYIDSNDEVMDVIMNCYKKDITGLEALSLTRLVDFAKIDATDLIPLNSTDAVEYSCGTELVQCARLYFFDPTQPTGVNRYGFSSYMFGYAPSAHIDSLWSQIDYSPAIQIFDNTNSNGNFDIVIDLDVYAHMTLRQFEIFTTTCVLSLYKTVGINDQVNFKAVKR